MTSIVEQPPDVTAASDESGRRRIPERDHVVETLSAAVAVVTDRGRHRARNEDAGAVAIGAAWAGLVVCDGVGSTRDSDRAALAASVAGRDALRTVKAQGRPLAEQLAAAVDAGSAAAVRADDANPPDVADQAYAAPPSCTFVAAAFDGAVVAAASVGDSRAYWLPDVGAAVQLTSDDSFAAAQIALGVSPDAANRGPYAHVITRWLGAGGPVVVPDITSAAVTTPGWLLVCSDGLWNYLATAEDLAARVAEAAPGDAESVAEKLVAWANDQGGRDNITVALARIERE